MADNLARIPIGKEWIDLNDASGLAVGTALKIQHVGGSRVDIAVSASAPTSEIGEVLVPWSFYGVNVGETNAVWAKIHPKSGGARLSVQDNT